MEAMMRLRDEDYDDIVYDFTVELFRYTGLDLRHWNSDDMTPEGAEFIARLADEIAHAEGRVSG